MRMWLFALIFSSAARAAKLAGGGGGGGVGKFLLIYKISMVGMPSYMTTVKVGTWKISGEGG